MTATSERKVSISFSFLSFPFKSLLISEILFFKYKIRRSFETLITSLSYLVAFSNFGNGNKKHLLNIGISSFVKLADKLLISLVLLFIKFENSKNIFPILVISNL